MNNEENKKSSLKKFIKGLDHFAVTFQFRIDKDEKYGSVTGGIWFIIFVIIAVSYTIIRFFDFISLSDNKIQFIEKASNPGPELNFKDNNFVYGIRLTFDNDSSLVNTTISDLFLIEHAYTTKKDGKTTKKIISKPRPCLDKDFFNKSQEYPIFQRNNIEDFNCFDLYDNFTLKGIYTDNEMSYSEILVSINPLYFSNYSSIEKIFNENQFKFTIYYMDTFNDVSNLNQSVFSKVDAVYSYIDLNYYKRYNMDFQKFTFSQDKNLFYNDYKDETYMKIFQKLEILSPIQNREYSKLEDNTKLNKFIIRAVNESKIVKLSFIKIPDFLAGLSGLLVNMLLVLTVLMTFLNRFEAKQSIMNKIMKYKDAVKENNQNTLDYLNNKFQNIGHIYDYRPSQIQVDKKNDLDKENNQEKDKNYNHNINLIKIENNENLITKEDEKELNLKFNNIENMSEKEETFLDKSSDSRKFSKVSNKTSRTNRLNKNEKSSNLNPFSIKFSDICCFIFCCKSIKKKQKIFVNAEKKFNNNIDLVTFMKKMQEIEILKYLLLDRDTLRLMNFISKPCVSLTNKKIEDEEYQEFFDIFDNNTKMSYQSIDDIKKSYDKILKKQDMSFTEKRILKLFGLHIEEILY
jgi:hypothetical protein